MTTVYLKPTNYCNIDCTHCYLPPDVRTNKQKMTVETLESVAELLNMQAKLMPSKPLHIIWHGGEPLILSPDYFEMAISIFNEKINHPYTQSIQSSLIPYHSKHKPIIHRYFNSHIGSSIDLTSRHIQGDSERYLNLWLDKVLEARRDGITITPGMVPTVSQLGQAHKIMAFMYEHEFHRFNIDRFSYFGTDTINWPSNKQHSEFLIELFDEVFAQIHLGKAPIIINVIVAALRGVLYQQPGDRWGTQCQKSFFVIEPNGNFNSCPDRALHEPAFGNINDGPMDVLNAKERRRWIRVSLIDHKKPHCHTCEYNVWCKSGCPVTPNATEMGQTECSGYKLFLNHVAEFIVANKQLVKDYLEYAH